MIHRLFCLSMDFDKTVAKEALLSLVNISADEDGAALLLKEVSDRPCRQHEHIY